MKTICFACFIVFILSCKKQDVSDSDVIYDLILTDHAADADATTSIPVSVKLNHDADADKRKVVLTVTGGSLDAAGNKTITIPAEFSNGDLIARAQWKMPGAPATLYITAKPEAVSAYQDFILKDSVTLRQSVATKIQVTASAFGVPANYTGEVKITGNLKNAKGRNASAGYKVLFEDLYENGSTVKGRFREMQASSNESGTVGALYSPGPVPVGTTIQVIVTLLDELNHKTDVKDTAIVNVITL